VRRDPEKYHRRSTRLRGYDYAQPGAYFFTICTRERKCLFGEIVDGEMVLNERGEIVAACWHDLPNHYPHVRLDAFVIMPNHVHGIIVLLDDDTIAGADLDVVGAGVGARHASPLPFDVTPTPRGPKRGSVGAIVGSFKSAVTRRINMMRGTPGMTIWQRNYYEHIIRDKDDLYDIRRYIAENPLKWDLDHENPAARSVDKTPGIWWGTAPCRRY